MRRKKRQVRYEKYCTECKHGNEVWSVDEFGPPTDTASLTIEKCGCQLHWQCIAPNHYGFRLEE